ncbi:MAG: NAD(P)H-dependent oxidoreductase [Desulfarculus sp.]|nr:NAD(P)H-dependent oxidoreductase [Pseudomonadota bacterium]MBV1716942.1 NAD(P)H-dependent oxidoreductase [Desulfarculus sp.]MBU4573983.1 NAD(P)H-dependent oxidoreductase [Pseudomonadota bacterium]MBU4597566.1 NAD(P)H-dependent oxidoreductase [Pseudomonadota bacterium]MBV1736518.1 NAD(P)H-dependent oxidoreductase [Desulfarculus sp.]
MAEVLIVYSTDHKGTLKMAEKVAAGVDSIEGCKATIKHAEEAKAEDVLAADALVLGSPVHMASMEWRMKKFIDQECSGLWMGDKVAGKAGAVFACGSGYGNAGGGCELTMLAMLNNLAELGMVLVPLPKDSPGYAKGGLQWGPYGRAHNEDISVIKGGLPEERSEVCIQHGKNIARVAEAIRGKALFG